MYKNIISGAYTGVPMFLCTCNIPRLSKGITSVHIYITYTYMTVYHAYCRVYMRTAYIFIYNSMCFVALVTTP